MEKKGGRGLPGGLEACASLAANEKAASRPTPRGSGRLGWTGKGQTQGQGSQASERLSEGTGRRPWSGPGDTVPRRKPSTSPTATHQLQLPPQPDSSSLEGLQAQRKYTESG